MSSIILFNKPFNTLCQFRGEPGDHTLAEYVTQPDVYPAGRLDKDSEGLLLLTADGQLQQRITHPRHKLPKTYWVQVEGIPTPQALGQLEKGVHLKDGKTRPAKVGLLDSPLLWERHPPIRNRKHIPTQWITLTITEGRNRQVRRMTAHIGHPTLRLIRVAIGPWHLQDLQPGQWREAPVPDTILSQLKPHQKKSLNDKQKTSSHARATNSSMSRKPAGGLSGTKKKRTIQSSRSNRKPK